MKKLITALLIAICLLSFTGAAYAAGTGGILEVPDVKIIMDGQITKYNDVPIIVNQNMLLPLRELFNNLGVPDENIIYDDQKKSVTVAKDQIKIYMEVGSKTAYVNDQPVILNTAPIGYTRNQRIYIPFRFAAEVLGKKVVWDGSANAILVCDAIKYENIRQLLEKSYTAMEQINKCITSIKVDGVVKSEQFNAKLGVLAESQIDKVKKAISVKMVMDILGMEMKSDSYYCDNTSYTLNPLSGGWEKVIYPQADYDKLFADKGEMNILNAKAIEPLCAGLEQVPGNKPDEILLQGEVYLSSLLKSIQGDKKTGSKLAAGENTEPDTFHMKISLNSSTYLVNNIIMNVGSEESSSKAKVKTDIVVNVEYRDYNGDFQVIVPQEVIVNAIVKK
jgi:hypothetical protein